MTPREIRRLRGSLGMTQAHFAALLHSHSTTVSRWESETHPLAPDAWRISVMRAMRDGYARIPSAADSAVAFLDAGMVALALGALLGPAADAAATL